MVNWALLRTSTLAYEEWEDGWWEGSDISKGTLKLRCMERDRRSHFVVLSLHCVIYEVKGCSFLRISQGNSDFIFLRLLVALNFVLTPIIK